LQNDLDEAQATAKNAVLKGNMNVDLLKSTGVDRDRYMDLYHHENELRVALDQKGESSEKLLYEC